MNKQQLQQKIDSALSSLDGLQRAEPNPFLQTRINAALAKGQAGSSWSRIAAFISRPAVAFSIMVLFIALNTLILFSNSNDGNTTAVSANEYVYASNSVLSNYDLENIQP